MNFILYLCIFSILIIILYNNFNCGYIDNEIDIEKYKIKTKKCININDKYNIKEYDVINDNIIIHSKYKNELLNLKKNKSLIDKQEQEYKEKKIKERNNKIKINSEMIKNYEFKQQIENLKLNIKSIKLLLKNELNIFLTDYNNKKISSDDIKNIIINLKNELHDNNKLLDNKLYDNINNNYINEYLYLLNIKNKLLIKKINIYSKFLF